MKLCSAKGCNRFSVCKGWCDKHYRRMLNNGSLKLLLPKCHYRNEKGEKRCPKCGTFSPISNFYVSNNRSDKLSSLCKKCKYDVNKIIEKRDPIRTRLTRMFDDSKRRAKKRKQDFNLTREDIFNLYVNYCPVFNTKLVWDSMTQIDESPTLDQINPELGYIKGNVWIVSWKVNRIKSNLSPEDLKIICNQLLKAIKKFKKDL